jgi:hypothetical protein
MEMERAGPGRPIGNRESVLAAALAGSVLLAAGAARGDAPGVSVRLARAPARIRAGQPVRLELVLTAADRAGCFVESVEVVGGIRRGPAPVPSPPGLVARIGPDEIERLARAAAASPVPAPLPPVTPEEAGPRGVLVAGPGLALGPGSSERRLLWIRPLSAADGRLTLRVRHHPARVDHLGRGLWRRAGAAGAPVRPRQIVATAAPDPVIVHARYARTAVEPVEPAGPSPDARGDAPDLLLYPRPAPREQVVRLALRVDERPRGRRLADARRTVPGPIDAATFLCGPDLWVLSAGGWTYFIRGLRGGVEPAVRVRGDLTGLVDRADRLGRTEILLRSSGGEGEPLPERIATLVRWLAEHGMAPRGGKRGGSIVPRASIWPLVVELARLRLELVVAGDGSRATVRDHSGSPERGASAGQSRGGAVHASPAGAAAPPSRSSASASPSSQVTSDSRSSPPAAGR